jgi:ADP-ribosylglycohydrolase
MQQQDWLAQPPQKPELGPRSAAELTPPRALSQLTPWQQQVAGVVLGGAIGDAMGHPTEFLSMEAIRERYGPNGVMGFELYWGADGKDRPETTENPVERKRFAPYTDDTQMAEAVLLALLDGRDHKFELDDTMNAMAERFVEWSQRPQGGHRAPGNACLSGCRALAAGAPWHSAGGETAGGCGSVMRAYPFGIVFVNDLSKAEHWSVAHSKLTHRDPIALAASAAMAIGTALALRHETPRVICSEMIAAAARYSSSTGTMVAQAYEDAMRGVTPDRTLNRLRAWAAHEAIAAAVYIFARHPDDARSAILEGANTPGDSDSIATLAGSLVGARVGLHGLPREWVADVERSEALQALAVRASAL